MYGRAAHLYDLIYEAQGKDYAAEAAGIVDIVGANDPGAESLLDVGCGTGAHLAHLRHRFQVEGVDLEPAMLAVAAGRLPGVPLHVGDMRTFSLGRQFDAVICLFSAIGHMGSTDDLERAVANMSAHLSPGGVLVFDGWLRPEQWHEPGMTLVETAESDAMTVVRASRSRRDGRVTTLEMHHLVVTLDAVDHIVENHVMTLFSPDEYETALAGAGLDFEVVPSPMPGRDRYVGRPRFG